jgi:hypothetical protein
MQFDLGSIRTDISIVRVVGRSDQYADWSTSSMSQQSGLSVWLSSTTAFQSGTLCAANLSPSVIGETMTVLCPVNASARYVTVWMNTTGRASGAYAGIDFLTLAEVTPMYEGGQGAGIAVEWGHAWHMQLMGFSAVIGCMHPCVRHAASAVVPAS